MGARRKRISKQLDISLVSTANEWLIELNKRREIPYLQATMYYSIYYISILMTTFLTIFRRFPNTFRKFPKILQNNSEGQTNFSEHFPRFSEDCREKPDDVSIIHWFRTLFANHFLFLSCLFFSIKIGHEEEVVMFPFHKRKVKTISMKPPIFGEIYIKNQLKLKDWPKFCC